MRTQVHPGHLYVRNKSPKATQGVMNPRVSSPLAPSVSWCVNNRGRKKETPTDLFQRCPHPFKPSTRGLPSRVAPSTASTCTSSTPIHQCLEKQSTSTPKVMWLHKHSNLCLLCALAAERAPPAVLSFVIYMQPLRWVYESVSLLNGVMKIPNLGRVCVCAWGRGHSRFKGCFNNTLTETGLIYHISLCHQKEIDHIWNQRMFFFFLIIIIRQEPGWGSTQ